MQKKATEPFIRFVGYIDAWEHCALKSLCNLFVDGNWIEAKDQSDTGIRLVQTGNIGTSEYIDKEDKKRWISEETFDRLHCIEIFPGDILISRLPEPAGRACIVPDTGTRMITAVDCTIIRTAGKCDSHYLVQYLSASKYFAAVNAMLGGGTRQRISRGNLAGINIPIPSSKEEQVNIGSFLTELNRLILMHQRKYEKLVNLKKAMLDKMFPQTGELVPEVRFAVFSGVWQEKSFGELFSYERPDNYIVEYDQYSNDYQTPVLTANKSFIIGYTKEQRVCDPPCIIFDDFTLDNKYVDFPFMVKSSAIKILRPKDGVNLRFAYERLNSTHVEIMGHARHYISTVQRVIVRIPDSKEQARIGSFFENLDKLISLQLYEVENLQNLKSAFLEKMFV